MKNEKDSGLIYIPVGNLMPHPDNPRKVIDNLDELVESVKKNGILQNLTVVPYFSKIHNRVIDGMYTVIIGHRRLAAAKAAGLKQVPCVIADMTPEEQLSTMLVENMQRNDLTVFEQAKSFQQLSIDFGKTTAEISEMSGFSESTVRHRQKMAELDEKAVKAGCERGATIFDFIELEKLDDPKAKEECLKQIGTSNFKNAISAAIADQKFAQKMAKWISQVSTFATKIEKSGELNGKEYPMSYVRNYNRWSTRDEDVVIPDNSKEVRYFFTASPREIDIYRDVTKTQSEKDQDAARIEKRAREENREREIREITSRHQQLRQDFVMHYGAAKSHIATIAKMACSAVIAQTTSTYYTRADLEDLSAIAGIKYNDVNETLDEGEFRKLKAENPEKALLLVAYWALDSRGNSYVRNQWDIEEQRTKYIYCDNQKLDRLYYDLEELGYECCDEELQMRRGTHPLLEEINYG